MIPGRWPCLPGEGKGGGVAKGGGGGCERRRGAEEEERVGADKHSFMGEFLKDGDVCADDFATVGRNVWCVGVFFSFFFFWASIFYGL